MTLKVLGINLGILGILGGIICLILSIRHTKHCASQLIGFMLSRISFDTGSAFHLDFISIQT